MKRIHPSGSQKRKLRKAKTEEAKSLAGSLSKYLSARGENKDGEGKSNQTVESGSGVQIIIDVETTNTGEKPTVCDFNEDFDVSDTEKKMIKIVMMRKLLRMNIFLMHLTSTPLHPMILHIGQYLFQSISEL